MSLNYKCNFFKGILVGLWAFLCFFFNISHGALFRPTIDFVLFPSHTRIRIIKIIIKHVFFQLITVIFNRR